MNRINTGKVIVGGLVAGLVINVGELILNLFVVAEQSAAAMEAVGMAQPGGAGMAVFIVMAFIIGILAVWLYAAIRPRFGPGPRTAILAGLLVWALFIGMGSINYLMMGMWPVDLILIGLCWGLFEMCLATLFGARFYSEADTA